MHRIDHATAKADLHGAGKDGFTEGSPGVEAPTVVTSDWANAVQEELANVVEQGGAFALIKANNTQLVEAIERHTYRTPVTRVRVLHASAGIPIYPNSGALPGGVPPWHYEVDGNGYVLRNNLPNAQLLYPLSWYVPAGGTVTRVRAMVTPVAAYAANAGMSAFYSAQQATFSGPSVSNGGPHGLDYDNETATLQILDTGVVSAPINKTSTDYVYQVRANESSGVGDKVHAIEITYTDPGPRNF